MVDLTNARRQRDFIARLKARAELADKVTVENARLKRQLAQAQARIRALAAERSKTGES